MKKALVIIMVLLQYGTLLSSNGQAETYQSHQIFVEPGFLSMTFYTMVVDPGHGGPAHGGGRKYGENGDYHGSCGYYDSLSEQWANLGVAFCLRDSLTQPGWWQQTVLMTRETQHDPDTTYIDAMWYRVQCGNYGNNGFPVYGECISIHFNGLTPTADQRTETWMSRYEQTDSGYYKVIAPKLSEKIVSSNHWNMNRFHPCVYSDPCYECYRDGGVKYEGEGPNEKKFVLRNWIPASTLIEFSDISWDPAEEDFLEDSLGCHTELLAASAYWGWKSYKNNSGILTVKNISVDGGGGFFYVIHDGIQVSTNSPFVVVAPEGDVWRINFVSPQIIGQPPAKNYFAHSVIECGDQLTLYDNTQSITYTVPNCSTHEITAYYRGGPYTVDIICPQFFDKWEVGQLAVIKWEASSGTDSTSLIDILLSRNGGGTWETIATNIPFDTLLWYGCGCYYWMVDGVTSSNCKVRVRAHDWAGNLIEDTSDVFSIIYKASLEHPPSGVEWQIGNSVSIQWTASPGHDSTSLIDIYLSTNGGTSWNPLLTNVPFDTIPQPYHPKGRVYWMVSGNTSSNCRIKIRAHDSAGNTVEVVSNQFSITYKLQLLSPEDFMCVGWVWWIRWRASPGEDSSTVVDFYLSRDGGDTWPECLGSRAWINPEWSYLYGEDTITWLVTPPSTNHGKIRLYAHDSYGHTAADTSREFTVCGGCIRGDIVKDGKYYLVTDAVVFAWWFVDSSDVCDPDPVYGISPCDVNCDGRVSLGDLIYLVRVICGDFSPCDTGPPYEPGSPPYAGEIEVKAKDNTISISSAYPTSALAFDFNREVDPVLIATNMQMKVKNGKVLVWNLNGDTIPPGTHDILFIDNAKLVSVRAAGSDGKEFKANITSDITTPSRYALLQNYPNPFNPNTWISFTLPNATAYTLKIYNVAGQLARSYEGMGMAGLNTITWDGRDNADNRVSSGIYFYRLQASEYNEVRKMVMLK